MQRRIYLLRHGDVSYFSSDGQPVSFQHAALNDHGIAQAIALGEIIAPIVFQKYVFSGLLRSHQTMDLVVGKREAGSSPDFFAYPDFGEIQPGAIHTFPGTDFDHWKNYFLSALGPGLNFDSRFMGGETFFDFTNRVNRSLCTLLEDSSWTNALVVAHSVVNRWILCRFLGLWLDGIHAIEQDSGCMNVIDIFPDGKGVIRLMNYTPVDRAKVHLRKNTLEMLFEQSVEAHKKNNPT